jgi:diguanylate cyclase (GGDEF)-like protein
MLGRLFDVEYQNEAHSYWWLWASISFMQFTLAYYVVAYDKFYILEYQVNLLVYVISSIYFVIRLLNSTKTINSRYLEGAITLSTLNWLLMSHVIYQAWNVPIFAEKMLIVGFFSTLICFSNNIFFMIISTLPIVIADLYFKVAIREVAGIDLMVSTVKYPLFLLATVYTTLHFNRELRDSHQRIILLNNELTRLKNTDSLTGLNNRRVFDEKLEYVVNMHNRLVQPLSLMILDVDYFKNYNDSLGHPAGDQCLITLSELMQKRLQRQSDVLARIGGEEFAIILPATNLEQCQVLAKSLVLAIEQGNIAHPNSSISDVVTISVGIACIDEQSTEAGSSNDGASLYKNADNALYRAKEAGRNRVAS